MLGLTTILFSTLIVIASSGESKASVGTSVAEQRCDGYWDSSSGGGRCRPWSTGAVDPKTVSTRQTPVSPVLKSQKPDVTGDDAQVHKMQEGAASSPIVESGASQSAPGTEETSNKVTVQLSGVAIGGRSDKIEQPSLSSRISEPAANAATDYSEQKVGQEGQRLGTAEGLEGAKYNGRDGGKEGKKVSEEQTPGPDSRHALQMSMRGAASPRGHSHMAGVTTDDLDAQDPAQNSAHERRSAAQKRCAVVVAAAFSFICL
ncbi:expression site-associated gene (ESAG) protein, putative; expression site-associated gene 9 (ESAG9) protein, putative [Trypanosoma brucei brucei TREU927]|uniref:Expression site-associated gene (ESAG) protein, putative expression site-associated gene 9 (ESAG9) protein, putative n=1 Tax=Trypanosoma brucei brucei (strain 927/4 GUTat10.1) TaxID=185431 RepID=Q4GY72_TRYB2|nr:expression site-associated gene (ESAG) protein; expression site-associated gene 9 (ESAG9) [Trypanosoma brucei brucei TREU927]CAJ16714.1 expression site-associated gene (ESAG) protein, putative; expression site-associated gene 9 (ESAG9) protein, putative [Trypanosoma brucei brucei TREU927]